MATSKPSLQSLRQEIDRIDREIHDLIIRRGEVVAEVAAVKTRDADGVPPIRPGREAIILRELARRHTGAFPLPELLRIWREMIAGYTRMQAPFAVAVAGGDVERPLRDIARDHYGSQTPIVSTASAQSALRAVMEGTATIAVVPFPEEDDPDPWWTTLPAEGIDRPQVIARLPFAPPSPTIPARSALAIARIVPEPTGEDRGLVAIDASIDLSRTRLAKLVRDAGFVARSIFASVRAPGGRNLIEVEGLVLPADPRLERLVGLIGDPEARVRPLGGYAVPLALPEPASQPPAPAPAS